MKQKKNVGFHANLWLEVKSGGAKRIFSCLKTASAQFNQRVYEHGTDPGARGPFMFYADQHLALGIFKLNGYEKKTLWS